MKLREQKKLGILYLVLGAVLFLVGLLTDASDAMNWLSSFGGAIAAVGTVRLLRVFRLTRDPVKAADYDASLTDERTAYVANKARSLAFTSASMPSLLPRWLRFCSLSRRWSDR